MTTTTDASVEIPEPDEVDEAPSTQPTSRGRIIAFIVGVVLLAVVGAGYLVWASNRVDTDLAEREARALEAVEAFEAEQTELVEAAAIEAAGPALEPGDVIFVHRVPGDDYGRLGVRSANGTRRLLDRSCERVHIAADRGVCVAGRGEGVLQTFRTEIFDASDARLQDIRSYASPFPSRARVSPDGQFISTTGFISGTSYADIGAGDTQTLAIIDPIGTRTGLVGLSTDFESFDLDGAAIAEGDHQFWGVTFVDENSFYATGFYGEEPEIIRGNIDERQVDQTGFVGSCPSLSPDGDTLVFKQTRVDGGFDLVAVDLETEETWMLGETRSVDDQVEWLDNDTILYAIHPEGVPESSIQPQFDIWSLDLAPGSTPELFLPSADSPATLR